MELVPAYAATAAAGLGAVLDVRARRIPNWLTGSALLGGLVLHVWLTGASGALVALAGAALGLVLLLPFYALRAMGAGDVKLLAGVGALVGPQMLISVAVYGGVVGGLLSLGALLVHGRLFGALHEVLVLRTVPVRTGLKTPYAVAIAAGTLLTLLLPRVMA
jgi:prepilin peptidase CpaA